jgi:hypothetical protein
MSPFFCPTFSEARRVLGFRFRIHFKKLGGGGRRFGRRVEEF